ncbi:MAG: TetR/AcrR family transcriptional regulator [Tildeniella nuda ZEHNDER 1965/U140]|jgi:AcrR family transcriptional regulator|nr:TetR/AcrR family transcriptional regulator [Tildeniella nuda ZEHNDER 1965/U140]
MESVKPPNPIRHLSPEKTAAILDGATRIFLEEGYAGTTMDRVAMAAGVSKPTIYSHFQDKEGLFNALMAQMVQKMQWAHCAQSLRESPPESPEVVLRQLANNMLDSCIGNLERITFIRLVMGESGRFPALGRAFVQHAEKPTLEALTHYLTACSALHLPDPAVAARMFMGTVIYFFMTQELLHGEDIIPLERDRLVDQLIALIVTHHSATSTIASS